MNKKEQRMAAAPNESSCPAHIRAGLHAYLPIRHANTAQAPKTAILKSKKMDKEWQENDKSNLCKNRVATGSKKKKRKKQVHRLVWLLG
jgi:hypothetical protein